MAAAFLPSMMIMFDSSYFIPISRVPQVLFSAPAPFPAALKGEDHVPSLRHPIRTMLSKTARFDFRWRPLCGNPCGNVDCLGLPGGSNRRAARIMILIFCFMSICYPSVPCGFCRKTGAKPDESAPFQTPIFSHSLVLTN